MILISILLVEIEQPKNESRNYQTKPKSQRTKRQKAIRVEPLTKSGVNQRIRQQKRIAEFESARSLRPKNWHLDVHLTDNISSYQDALIFNLAWPVPSAKLPP
jgi:hypothetical protein